MNTLIPTAMLADLLINYPSLQAVLDFTLKSSVIILLTMGIAALLRHRLSSDSRHLLWLNSMLCCAVLPLTATILTMVAPSLSGVGSTNLFVVVPGIVAPSTLEAGRSIDVFLMLYLAVTGVFLLRMLVAGYQLATLSRGAQRASSAAQMQRLHALKQKLQIRRAVDLLYSDSITSPVSFGLFRPRIILPTTAHTWSEATREDVLIHELSHIRRLDWPTMLFCHALVCLAWFNPLVWIVRRRVDAAAEQACDGAVIALGNDGVRYAEDLLQLARSHRNGRPGLLLAQAMFDSSALAGRIRALLGGSAQYGSSRRFRMGLSGFALAFVVSSGFVTTFGANAADGDYLPLTTITPQYPTRAAEEGIEGWVLLHFTVTSAGLVDESTITTIDAEPADIFERSAARAAAQFTFQPRVVNGVAVTVPGVQYLFRYELKEGSTLEGVRRPPSPARDARTQQTD